MVYPIPIQKFRTQCEQTYSRIKNQREDGFLGRVEVRCRTLTGNFTIEIQGFPIFCIPVRKHEVRLWAQKRVPYPTQTYADADTPIKEWVDLTEDIVFRIYEASGYGLLSIEFWYSKAALSHKAVFHWEISFREVSYIDIA